MKKFIRELFSASTSASFGRTGAAVVITALLLLAIWQIVHGAKFADIDVPQGWIWIIGILYGCTKAPELASAVKGTPWSDT